MIAALALSLWAQPPGMTTIRINTRDMTGPRDREDVIRGTCDGRPASATIRQDSQGRPGRLVLHSGRWTREVPSTFLNRLLLTSSIRSAQLACDGQSLQLHALAVRRDAQGEIVMDVQDAIMDLRSGVLSMTELTTLSAAETRSEIPARLPMDPALLSPR